MKWVEKLPKNSIRKAKEEKSFRRKEWSSVSAGV